MDRLPCFILIDRALRDEGTSYHYMPPADFSAAPAHLLQALSGAFGGFGEPVLQGATWTTDAPFRETAAAIDAMTQRGLLAVEMEAAALYAFAAARGQDVVCFAHVTNQMGQIEGDFEKGEADGATQALALVTTVAGCRVAFKSGTPRVERRLLPLNVAFRRQLVGVFPCFAVRSGQLRQEGGAPFQTHEARQLLRTHQGQC